MKINKLNLLCGCGNTVETKSALSFCFFFNNSKQFSVVCPECGREYIFNFYCDFKNIMKTTIQKCDIPQAEEE